MTTYPTILLFGRRGQIAWELHRSLGAIGQVRVVGSNEVNLTQPEAIREALGQIKPQIIVNAAAYTAVDLAETDADIARAINTIAPGIMAEAAARLGSLLVHYSTDYIFDGRKAEPYLEGDRACPLGVYGQTKWDGEEAIRAQGTQHLILRTTWVYGLRGHNFLLTMLKLAAEKPELRVVADQIGAPTWSRAIAEATGQILAQWPNRAASALSAQGAGSGVGTYHLTAGGATSWHGFATAICAGAQQLGRELAVQQITPIPTSAYPTPAQRPANSRLNGDLLAQTFGLRLPDWQESLDLVLADLG